MPHDTPCPKCGRTLVHRQHIIEGRDVTIAFYCAYCEHRWSARQPIARAPAIAPLKPRTRRDGRKRSNG